MDDEKTKTFEANVKLPDAVLQDAAAILEGILPICGFCKKIRKPDGTWQQLESFISTHSEAQFSHGLCEECLRKQYPEHSV
jgi:hypothetical protein